MEFNEVIRNRYSVREYLDKPVEADKLLRVLEAARLAPSGSNRQPWRFVVVQDPARRKAMAHACCDQAFIATAAVVIAGVGLMPDRMMSCNVPGDPVDLAIALEHIALAAVNEGLGTCWIGAFGQDAVRGVLGIPATAKVIEVMALGYPANTLPAKTRKCMEEIVCHEQWRDKPLSL
jgi:nitroreductase